MERILIFKSGSLPPRDTGHDSFFEAFVGDEQSILSQEKLKKEKG